ncbi:hypothetical protein GC177_00710 [bacterium]|nr:hypothetical protein [bacterium]
MTQAEAPVSGAPDDAAAKNFPVLQDIQFFGRPQRGRKEGIGLNRVSLVLGEPGTVTPDHIACIKDALMKKGVDASAIHVRLAPKAPSEAELIAYKAKKAGPYDSSTQTEMRVVVDVGPLNRKEQHSTEWLDYFNDCGIADDAITTQARNQLAEQTMPLMARIRRDGPVKAIKHEYAVSPIKLIGRMYFIGDTLSFLVGLMNSIGTIKSRGYGDLAFGVACSATGIVMSGWGDRPDPNSPSQALMDKMDHALAGKPSGYPAAAKPQLPKVSLSEQADTYLAEHAAAIGKVGLIVASGGLFMAGVQQKNPIKMVQSFFASVGFPISLMMPKEGIRLEDTRASNVIKQNPLAQKTFHFLQERPNSLIALAVIHNALGFGTAARDIVRSEPAKEALRQQFSDEAFQPNKIGKDGQPMKWWDLPRKELIAHAKALGNEEFIEGIANYQMYNRLRLSAVPYALMVGTYFVTNALFGLTVEPKRRVHPDELFSLAAERWLRTADTSLAPQALAESSMSALASMVQWLAQQPAVRFAQQTGKLPMEPGESLEHVLARGIIGKAGQMAPLTGQDGAYRLLAGIAEPVLAAGESRQAEGGSPSYFMAQPSPDNMLSEASVPLAAIQQDNALLDATKTVFNDKSSVRQQADTAFRELATAPDAGAHLRH